MSRRTPLMTRDERVGGVILLRLLGFVTDIVREATNAVTKGAPDSVVRKIADVAG